MRFIFLIFFLNLFLNCLGTVTNNQKERANQLYSKGLYKEAGVIYDSLLRDGNYSKNILYRMAYISERFNRYGEAIFFLRKTAIEYGDKEAEERIHILMDKSGLEGVMADDRLGYYDYINRNTLYIVLTLIFVTALLGLYYWKSRNIKVLKNLFGLLIADAIIISGLIYSNYLMPARCVIISNTAFYESPSYASQSKTEAPVPGSIMKIKEKKDIWCEVSLNNKNYWIPFFTVREF